MADTLALEKLYDDVVAKFAAEGTSAAQPFGWREVAKQLTVTARIVWVPGARAGSLGELGAAISPGGNPRSLFTLLEQFYCVISASDNTQPENERAQYKATRLLYNAWLRALYLVAPGTVTVLDQEWIVNAGTDGSTPRHERRHGAAIIVTCTVQSMIPDLPLANANADEDVNGLVDVSLLDVTESVGTQ